MPVHAMTLRTFTHDLKSGGESLVIDGPVIVRLVEKSGRVARLEITAPPETRIKRGGSALAVVDPMQTQCWQAQNKDESR